MKKASNVALAIGAGYLLGRKRKFRLALAVAGAAATGKLGSVATQAVKRGGSLAGSSEALGKLSPELAGVMGTVRGDLAGAGKAAVRAAATNRINRLTDSLHERAEGIRNARDEGEDEPEAAEPEAAGREPDELDDDGSGRQPSARNAEARRRSGRRDASGPRRREPRGRDTDRPTRRSEPERGDRDGGPRRRAAKRSSAGGDSGSSSARK